MSFVLPPIVKLAERLLVDVEQAVRRFARYHKYTYGTKLREHALNIARLAHRASRDRAKRSTWIGRLVWLIDDFKLLLQLGQQIKAFASFGQFESFARVARELGKQAGGWYRQQHPNGQNAASSGRTAATRDTEYPRRLGNEASS